LEDSSGRKNFTFLTSYFKPTKFVIDFKRKNVPFEKTALQMMLSSKAFAASDFKESQKYSYQMILFAQT
jgi:hypothetical protein